MWDFEILQNRRGDDVYEDLLDTVTFSGKGTLSHFPGNWGIRPCPLIVATVFAG